MGMDSEFFLYLGYNNVCKILENRLEIDLRSMTADGCISETNTNQYGILSIRGTNRYKAHAAPQDTEIQDSRKVVLILMKLDDSNGCDYESFRNAEGWHIQYLTTMFNFILFLFLFEWRI